MGEVLDRIRARGHWDVAIQPMPFDTNRVSYDALEVVLAELTVRMRGWPVPYMDDRNDYLRGNDWIGQDIDARNVAHLEAWRFFTSGQFSHLRVVSADYRVGREATSVPRGARSAIEVWEILFYMTELVELATRIALIKSAGEQMRLDVALVGMEGRQLISGTPSRELNGRYISAQSTLTYNAIFERERLIAEPRSIAVDVSQELMLRFGFKASPAVLSDYQQELTKGR